MLDSLLSGAETKLMKKPVQLFKDPCRKCGGRMLRTDVVLQPKKAHIKCEDCGHGATVVEAETARAEFTIKG